MNWEQLLSSKRTSSTVIPAKPDRSEFEKDFDRIIFSLPFRRLQDKTQVFPLPEDDFVHNRLTHSLEVASVGRSLGKLAGERILEKNTELKNAVTAAEFGAIVSAASLAHDVGNPPFGHSGESAISAFFANNETKIRSTATLSTTEWQDLINFEGNAQGFRLINQSIHGLKLTNATLGAFTKYPRQSLIGYNPEGKASQKKYGYYQSEKVVFQDLATTLGLKTLESNSSWARHPLAFLVEAADDICYHIIDLEDGTTLGLVSLEEAIELLRPIIGKRFDRDKLNSKASQHEKLGTLRALAINELIDQAVNVFVANEKGLLEGSFEESLTSLIPVAANLEEIKKISIEKIYRAQVVLEKEIAGYEVIDGLLSTLVTAVIEYTSELESIRTKTIIRSLPSEVTFLLQKGELYPNLRVLLDYISSMTDSHALTLYRKFKGMSLPSW